MRSADHVTLLCSILHSHVTPFLLDPNIFLSTVFLNPLSLRSSLYVTDQVSHPYKTKGKTTALYILIFIVSASQLEGTAGPSDRAV